MKLTAAKCPSCGANLEVDSKDEIAICKYCNSNIIIEEAIEKYKLELSGTIKVSGIKDNNDRLEDVKNYLKLKEYKNANAVLNQVIQDEPFNIEAYILRIKSYLGYFSVLHTDDEYETDLDLNSSMWKDVDTILSTYDRLKAIDEKKKYSSKLKNEIKTLEKIEEEKNKVMSDLELCQEIDEIIEYITAYKFRKEIAKATNRNYKKINKIITEYFNDKLGYPLLKVPDNVRCVYRDFTIKYYDPNSQFKIEKITKYHSLKELKLALEESKDDVIKNIENSSKNVAVRVFKNILKK